MTLDFSFSAPNTHQFADARCSLCEETLKLVQDDRKDFPEPWHVFAVHDHREDPPRWTVVVHHHPDRSRYYGEAKAVLEVMAQQKKEARLRAQAANAPMKKDGSIA